jgi:hypothetical protein
MAHDRERLPSHLAPVCSFVSAGTDPLSGPQAYKNERTRPIFFASLGLFAGSPMG